MSMIQPGVRITETLMTGLATDNSTAIPVFIGYAELGKPGELYTIASMDDYRDQLGRGHARSRLFHTVWHYFDNGGGPCFVLTVDDYDALDQLDENGIFGQLSATGLLPLVLQEPRITLVAMPDMVLLPADTEDELSRWRALWNALVEVCDRKTALFAVLDTPSGAEQAAGCIRAFGGGDKGAAYWPHLVTAYPPVATAPARLHRLDEAAREQRIVVPPSGAVVATIQRTDRERGVWKAPANVALAHVVKPEHSHLKAFGLFNESGCTINLIRAFPGRGTRIWGCRTVSANGSFWRYVQVRRLVSYIEDSLRELGRAMMYEPNNEITWYKLEGLAGAWLRRLWQHGGLFGEQEDQAFRVLVGLNDSMTADDIRAGKMIARISLALQYPAEFIELNLMFNLADTEITRHEQPLSASLLP